MRQMSPTLAGNSKRRLKRDELSGSASFAGRLNARARTEMNVAPATEGFSEGLSALVIMPLVRFRYEIEAI
jgi:hypothetical protein